MHRLHCYIIRTESVVVSQRIDFTTTTRGIARMESWSLIFTFNVPSPFSVVGVI